MERRWLSKWKSRFISVLEASSKRVARPERKKAPEVAMQFSQSEQPVNRNQFECVQRRRSPMAVELMDAIGRANPPSVSPDPFLPHEDPPLLPPPNTRAP